MIAALTNRVVVPLQGRSMTTIPNAQFAKAGAVADRNQPQNLKDLDISTAITTDALKRSVAVSSAVLALALFSPTSSLPAHALLGAPPGDRWDGESSAIGSCPLGEEGEQCRAQVLSKDTMLTYGQMNNSGKVSGKATGVPVSDVTSSAYKRDTTALAESLKSYMTLDPSDDNRVGLVKTLKKESLDWVSKYARGGSARAKSARTLYVVVDAVQGFIASNGYAPFPRMKAAKLVEQVDVSMEFLAQGK